MKIRTAATYIAKAMIITVVAAIALSGCASSPHRPSFIEDKPYPQVSYLKVDGVPFGLKVRFYSGSYRMDLPSTMYDNFIPNKDAAPALNVLESLNLSFPNVIKPPSGTEITFKGSHKDQDNFSRTQIEYEMKVDSRGVLLEFAKEISIRNRNYYSGPEVTADELHQFLIKELGSPNYTYSQDHKVSHVDTYWWGVDEKVLFKGGSYKLTNPYWFNRFYGKVIRADLYQYKEGDMKLKITMTDNYQWLQKMLR